LLLIHARTRPLPPTCNGAHHTTVRMSIEWVVLSAAVRTKRTETVGWRLLSA
jgi:hypothetical protein